MSPLSITILTLSVFHLCGIEFSTHGPSSSDNSPAAPCFHPTPKTTHAYSFLAAFSDSNFHNLFVFSSLQINKVTC